MLARRCRAHGVAVEDLVAIRADVDPVGVGSAGCSCSPCRCSGRRPSGAKWHREAHQVDVVALRMFSGRPTGPRRAESVAGREQAAPEVAQPLVGAGGRGQREGDRLASRRPIGVDEDAIAARVARDVVERTAGEPSEWSSSSVTWAMPSCQSTPRTTRSSPMASTLSSHSRVSAQGCIRSASSGRIGHHQVLRRCGNRSARSDERVVAASLYATDPMVAQPPGSIETRSFARSSGRRPIAERTC